MGNRQHTIQLLSSTPQYISRVVRSPLENLVHNDQYLSTSHLENLKDKLNIFKA